MPDFHSDNINEVSLISTHDSWVKISDDFNHGMRHFFPDGWVPARDPFPMGGWSKLRADKVVQLWALDLKRMTVEQINGMLYIAATVGQKSKMAVLIEAAQRGGIFRIDHRIIDSVRCGKEGLNRLAELLDFLNQFPDQHPSSEEWEEFIWQHQKAWVCDRKTPKPITSIQDIHPAIIGNGVPHFHVDRGLIDRDEIVFEISNLKWS